MASSASKAGGESPIGEALAILPPDGAPVADLARSDTADHGAEIGVVPLQDRQRVLIRRGGADADRVAVSVDRARSATASSETVNGNVWCCLVTHSPTSVAPATITACGWSSSVSGEFVSRTRGEPALSAVGQRQGGIVPLSMHPLRDGSVPVQTATAASTIGR